MMNTHDLSRPFMVLVSLFLGAGVSTAAQPHALQAAQWLPDSCVAMVAVDSVQALTRQLKNTPLYDLAQDPTLKPMVTSVENKIRDNLKKKIASFWQDLKIHHPPQSLPWPQGRLVIGAVVQERDFPVNSPQDDNSPASPAMQKGLDWQFVGIADMDANTEETAKLLQQIASAAQAHDMVHRSRRVGSAELHWITADRDANPDYDTFCYALAGPHLIVSSSARLATETLRHIQHPGGRTLAHSAILMSLVHAVQNGLITFYVEADPIRKLLVDMLPDAQKGQVQNALQKLGLQSIRGLITSIRFNGQPREVVRCQTLLATDGPPQGVFGLICPKSAALKPDSQILSPDSAIFSQSHLNLSQIYDRIVEMVRRIRGVDLNFFVQTALAATGKQGQQAPVDLKRDLLDQMAPPLTTTTILKRPFTSPDQARDLWSIPLRNSDIVDTALARIHRTFIARHNPKLQRKMLGHTLYLLPQIALQTKSQADHLKSQEVVAQLAFIVVNGELVLGRLEDLEQLVRNTRRDHPKTLAHDPMFRAARRYLPSQAGQYGYINLRSCGEFAWEWLRQSLQQGHDHQGPPVAEDSHGLSGSKRSVGNEFFRELRDLVSAEQLPSFHAIRQYFGAMISYEKRTDQGLFGECVILRAPSSLD